MRDWGQREWQMPDVRRGFLVAIAVLVVLLVIFSALSGFITDLLWFQSLGLASVFWTTTLPRWILFFVGTLVAAALLGGNWWGARALVNREPFFFEEPPLRHPLIVPLILGTTAFLALSFGASAGGEWDEVLRFLHRQPFSTTDPLFKRDIGFYVFALPVYDFVQGWLLTALIFAFLGTAGLYTLARLPQLRHRIFGVPRYMRFHLTLLGVAIALTWAAGYWLDRFNLLYSTRGVVFGASYTDVHAELLALNVLTALAVLVGLLLLASLVTRNIWVPTITLGVWLVAAITLKGIYPTIIQKYVVEPNEFIREKPYIAYNIASTLQAYGLANVTSRQMSPRPAVTVAELQQDEVTLRNVRLWDYRPLLQTYAQLQEIRSYYTFVDVDIDRYRFGDRYEQVMLAARELDLSQLQNPTWVNTHLEFTHGYGLVMSPVNQVNSRGLPVLYIADLPPKVTVPIEITRPQIYYGEHLSGYVFVKTKVREFDYPRGNENVRTTYEGTGGVPVDSLWKRLAFAYRFGDTQILFTNALTPESRVMLYRNIHERVRRVAPFLLYDGDPYLVIHNGHLVWIQDAYTVTDRYPYSEPIRIQTGRFNYIRNSVKVVIDAYHGSMTFYVADPEDPLVRAYQGIFPDLFTPLDQMPNTLRAHLRYPEFLFRVQAEIYRTYHMQNPNTFYNKEDVWAVPTERFQGADQPVEPYYVLMRLLDEREPEFVLILPFTPVGKQNMIAWMAGRSDMPHYGELVVYEFPKQELIYGPQQIESLIDQDPEISAQLSLWSQRGSDVIRGNLLVIPIGQSLLYVEPLYLRAETSELPELKRVIVSTGGKVAMEETFDQALARLFGTMVTEVPAKRTGASPELAPPIGTPGIPQEIADLIRSARQHYEAAQEAIRRGDWATYGAELEALRADLDRLAELTGATGSEEGTQR